MRDKPLVYWVSLFTEVEWDIWHVAQLSNKMDLRLASMTTYLDKFGWTNYSDAKKIVVADKTETNHIDGRIELLKRIAKENPDLIIIRYGHPFIGHQQKVNEALEGQNYWLWTSEQGCNRDLQEGIIKGGFENVLVNNKADLNYYKKYKNKEIRYLPFGCVPAIHKQVPPKEEFQNVCVSDGTPRYYASESIYKKISIDTMITPIAGELDLGLWGASTEVGNLGWTAMDWLKEYYRGKFSYEQARDVYSSCKIYLGITNNWFHGGYGKKLATALACGIFVIWHKTAYMELDFTKGVELEWSETAEQTLRTVKLYLEKESDRQKIALAGQKYAYENLDWEKNILRIVEETT